MTRKKIVKTADQLEPGDFAMIIDPAYPRAYHRAVLAVAGPNGAGVVVVTWSDPGESDETKVVNYGRTAQFDLADDMRSARRK